MGYMYHAISQSSLSRTVASSIARLKANTFRTIYYQNRNVSNFKMATARKIQLTPKDSGVFSPTKSSIESAEMASRLLQENHEVGSFDIITIGKDKADT
jgi:hypothetical protein